jgi:PAS domain S-box-containing protein
MRADTPSHRTADEAFQQVADSLPALVWAAGADKRCTYFNKPWLDFTGRRLEEEVSDGWIDGVHADDVESCVEIYNRAFDRRKPFTLQYRRRRHDGEYRWLYDKAAPLFEADGGFSGYIGTCFDVTDLRRAEAGHAVSADAGATLQRTERELQEAQRLAGVGSWQWLQSTDTAVWSEELYRIAGRDPGSPAVSYKDHARMYTRESWVRLRGAVEAVLYTGTPYELVLELVRPDGTHRWVMGRGEVLRDSSNQVMGLRGTLQDITERKLAEEALSSVNGRLIEAQESERARIARDLHDDIGQRVAVLAMALSQVKNMLPPGNDARDYVESIQKQTVEIIADVQALSHELRPPRLLHLGVVAAMQGFCQDLAVQHGVEIDFSSKHVPPNVPSDISLCLFRVLQEALHNAVRHSHVRRFEVQLHATVNAIYLMVRDQGAGFDFDTASRGKGLGLSSMKERLKLVGGELFVKTQPAAGTTVLARAPLTSG